MFREDAEGRKNPEPTCIAWLELEKGRSAEEPLKEIFAEFKVLSERNQMSTGPVLLLTLQQDGPVGKNRGPASDLSGISELRTGLKGLAHASNQSWQMVGTALSCQTVVDSVVGAAPKASLKRNADGSQAAVLKPTPKSRPASALSAVLSGAGPPLELWSVVLLLVLGPWSRAREARQAVPTSKWRWSISGMMMTMMTSPLVSRSLQLEASQGGWPWTDPALSQVSVPSVISNIQGNMVNISAVLARFTCNLSVLQWPAALVEDHLEQGHWPLGLPTGTELSINHLLLGWDVRSEDYDFNSHVYSTAAWGRTESSSC